MTHELHSISARHATGGEIPNVLPRLSPDELNVTQSVNNTGNVRVFPTSPHFLLLSSSLADISGLAVQMFEKFSMSDIDSAGRGGEYTVQAGFGWTNGVALWIASNYGDQLVAPICPNLTEEAATQANNNNKSGAITSGVSFSSFSGALIISVAVFLM